MAASCSSDAVQQRKGDNPRRSRPSKRIDAARFFLHNISLGSKVVHGPLRAESQAINHGSPSNSNVGLGNTAGQIKWYDENTDIFEDDSKLILDLPTTNKLQLHHSTSVANTNLFEESVSLNSATSGDSKICFARSKSYLDASNRASFSKNTQHHSFLSQQRNDIHLLDSKQFLSRYAKNMYGKRAVFISPNGLPIGSISVIPYKKEEKHNILTKDKRVLTVPHQASSNIMSIEGVEVGNIKRTVSYSHMLVPGLSRKRRTTFQSDLSEEPNHQHLMDTLYHPFLLDDPELTSGKHRKVLNLKSYTVSVIQYGKPSEIKKDINERFKERFPNLKITLSKLRSIKLEMLDIGLKCGVDRAIIACSHVYFEKLVLKEKITKANRKGCAGACLLLASKFNGDVKKGSFSPIIEAINDRFRLHLKDLLSLELLVLIALEFQLSLPPGEVNLMHKRTESMRTMARARSRYNYRSQYNARTNHHREAKS